MAINLTVDGVTYPYPQRGDTNWGQDATNWAQAVTAVVSSLRSPSLPVATTGKIRLGNTDPISWRNFANGGNITLFVNTSDRLIYDDGITQKDLSLTGGGNVQMNTPSLDNEVPRFDGVSGGVIQNSGILIDDSQVISEVSDLVFGATDLELSKVLPPIGTVIWHYDFNAGIPLPDSAYWAACDGSAATVNGGPQTLPDLSGRYIVGFGTDGGTDIDSAAFATAAVGNAGHTINIQHSHTVNAHQHSGNTGSTALTTNTDGAHSHAAGTLAAAIDPFSVSNKIYYNLSGNSTAFSRDREHSVNSTATPGGTSTQSVSVFGSTATDGAHQHTINTHSHTIANESPATDAQLSTTQSIQPRSIRMRAYLRKK